MTSAPLQASISPHGLNDTTDMEDFYNVLIDDKHIVTTVTKVADSVDQWIDEVESDHAEDRHRLIIGFDIELAPAVAGAAARPPVATIQLCAHRQCLIYQLFNLTQLPRDLDRFLTYQNHSLAGVEIESKMERLQNDFGLGVEARCFDLRELAAENYNRPALRTADLSGLSDFCSGKFIVSPAVGDWNVENLSENQVLSATINTFVSYLLGSVLVFPMGRIR